MNLVNSKQSISGLLKQKIIARGNGRSYGDSGLYKNYACMKNLNKFIKFDEKKGILNAYAGITLDEILQLTVPKGWFLSITPGTKYITLGGAVSSDVHGKNHHNSGSFSDSVIEMEFIGADKKKRTITPKDELFKYICGGMGLMGIIVSVKIKLIKINSAYVNQTTYKANNINEMFELFENHSKAEYSVAWLDCSKKGTNMGRGLFITGEFCDDKNFNMPKPKNKSLPFFYKSWMLNKLSIKLFNLLYFVKNTHKVATKKVDYNTYFYPLDNISNWNQMYGNNGFIQYQCVIPENSAKDGIAELLNEIANYGNGSFLSVLKKFRTENKNILSFPMAGYTLALDFKVQSGLDPVIKNLDNIVKKYNGRIYLAKDSKMDKQFMTQTYKNYDKFVKLRKKTGADKIFTSLQSERLGL